MTVVKKLKRNPDTLRIKTGDNRTEGRKITWMYIIKAGKWFEEWTGEFQSKEMAIEWFNENGNYWKDRGYEIHLMKKEKIYKYNLKVFS